MSSLTIHRCISSRYSVLFILLMSFLLRLLAINQSLWLDESIGAFEVKKGSFWYILTEFPKFDNHPPLYYLFLKLWTNIFGFSEFSLRLPSVLFGVATVFLVFKICKHLYKNSTEPTSPILVSLLIATSQLHIFYSQEARMYSMAAFLATLAVYSFLNLRWVLFSFSITALVFTDYLPLFLLPIFWLFSFFEKKLKDTDFLIRFLISHLPILILSFFWFPIFRKQVENGLWLLNALPGWKEVAGGSDIRQILFVWTKFVFGRISLINKSVYLVLVLFSSVPAFLGLLRSFIFLKKSLKIIWLWYFVPLVLVLSLSFIIPAFNFFRFLFLLPAFYILVGLGITTMKNNFLRVLSFMLLIVFNFLGLFIYWNDPRQQREKWREAVRFVEDKVSDSEIILFEYPEPFTPYRWYSNGMVEAMGATDSIFANSEKTREKTKMLIDDKSGIYYFEYLRDLSDPRRVVESEIINGGFKIKEEYGDFTGVGKITYWVKE